MCKKIISMLVGVFCILTLGMGSASAASNSLNLSAPAANYYTSHFNEAQRAEIEKTLPAEHIKFYLENEVGVKTGSLAKATAVNGCSSPLPGGPYRAVFRVDCNRHDICYGSSVARLKCDKFFLSDMKSTCKTRYPNAASIQRRNCNREADNYYHGVRTFGKSHYKGSGSNA